MTKLSSSINWLIIIYDFLLSPLLGHEQYEASPYVLALPLCLGQSQVYDGHPGMFVEK
jgi:hypothetical protein